MRPICLILKPVLPVSTALASHVAHLPLSPTHSVRLGPVYTFFRTTSPWELCKHRDTFPKPPLSRSSCLRNSVELILMSSKDMSGFLLKAQNAPKIHNWFFPLRAVPCEENKRTHQCKKIIIQKIYVTFHHTLGVPLFFEDRFIVSKMKVFHISRNHRQPQIFLP